MNKIYPFGADGRLIITKAALRTMTAHSQLADSQPESGGVLLGRHLIDSCDIVIDEVTTPQATDKRKRFSFFRSLSHNKKVKQRWNETNGTSAYLGLWHTHPEAVPTPSTTDLNDWNKASKNDEYEGDSLFFIIVGMKEIGVWFKSRLGVIQQLQLKIESNEKR